MKTPYLTYWFWCRPILNGLKVLGTFVSPNDMTNHLYKPCDVDQPRNTSKDPLHVPNGPMIRSKTKALKKALNALVLNVSTKSELKGPLEYQEETLVHLIHVQEGSNTTLFGPWSEDIKGNKRILLQLGNNMGGYLFLLLIGLRGCTKGYK
jgi:hypothetical protein